MEEGGEWEAPGRNFKDGSMVDARFHARVGQLHGKRDETALLAVHLTFKKDQ